MTLQSTDTAHLAWDAAWQSEAGRADWLVPEPEVVQLAARLRQNGARRALDLGCGVGRHALALARLGFEVEAVDASPAWNVIYHGDPQVVRGAVAEIARVLKPGGTYQGTMLSKRNRHFGQGREIAPHTWVDEAGEGDKAHPHFFSDAGELCALFAGFEVLALHQDDHGKPGHWHWHLVTEKR